MKRILFIVLALCLVLSGCKNQPAANPGSSQTNIEAKPNTLTTVSSYGDIYKQMKAYMDKRNDGYAYAANGAMEEPAEEAAAEEAPAAAPAEMKAETADTVSAKDAGDYSETNVQVEGIDEADIIKTDGDRIYYLGNGKLKIIDAKGAATKVLSETQLSKDSEQMYQYYNDMYISGNYIVAIGVRYDYNEKNGEEKSLAAIYDVSDPRNVRLVEEFGQSGYVSSTRMVGNTLYMISTYSVWDIDEDEPSTFVPCVYGNGAKETVAVGDICIPGEVTSTDWMTVSAFDIENRQRLSTKTMLGRADNIYMSGDYIYVAETEWITDQSDSYTKDQYTVVDYLNYCNTNIHKFAYANGEVSYQSTGAITGRLLNQFSMDEYDGNLRVVTTRSDNSYSIYSDSKYGFENYEYKDNSMDNGLYILDGDMKVVGSVEKLGEDERVYSVRFNGDVGYFVTFRETDPLFAVDLSDPANPKVLSALKINGFSQYLHSWGEDKLLGLGMEADDEGMVESMKLSMFDVSVPTDVQETNKLVLPYNYSEGLYNHHAVFVDVQRGLVGFGADEDYVLYKFDGEAFSLFATVKGANYGFNMRGLRIGSDFYIVDTENVRVVDLDTASVIL